jgi:hypothetical protein
MAAELPNVFSMADEEEFPVFPRPAAKASEE